MKYQFIEQQRQDYPVRVVCEVLEVSESGYYAWRKRQPDQHWHQADNELAAQVETIFEQSRQTYGSPRVHAALRTSGVSCSRRRMARVMRKKGLVSCWRRKKKFKVCTTDTGMINQSPLTGLIVISRPVVLTSSGLAISPGSGRKRVGFI